MYHAGSRKLQQCFGSTALADRYPRHICRDDFTDSDREFIERATFFFLATSDPSGRPDCSFKGGPANFVKIAGPGLLQFPDYDGNGMFKSLGNILENPFIGMLFIEFSAKPRRLRVNGRATIELLDEPVPDFIGAQAIINVAVERIFPNCPRYIPDLQAGEPSRYIPREGADPVEPEWKNFKEFRDVVPRRSA